MTRSVFNAAKRSAASLLILIATVGSTARAAFLARDFDPAPPECDHSVGPARAWYDHDFDTVPSEVGSSGGLESTAVKAWYDRDFDIPDKSEGN